MLKYRAIIFLISALFFKAPSIVASEIVIANIDSTQSIGKETIKKMYLGRDNLWENGEKVKLTILTKNGYFADFIQKLLNKSSDDFVLYWKQLLFTGRGIPPTEFSTIDELIHYIEKTKGAIGFVPASVKEKLPNNIKVVFVE